MLSVGSDLPEVEEVAEDDRERMITKVERRRWRWLKMKCQGLIDKKVATSWETGAEGK